MTDPRKPTSPQALPRPWQRWAVIIVAVLALLIWAACGLRNPDRGKLRVTVIDVGQGDSILIETPNRRTVLIDGGGANDESSADPHDIGLKVVVPYLHYRGINHLDILVLTHPHSDHVGGLGAVLREESVGVVLDGTVLSYPTPAYTEFQNAIKTKLLGERGVERFLGPA